jgi:predicted Ser/Thr protein kinase
MFKAPIKMLHPLLTATQDGAYVGTENVGALPYQGVILAHSNESEWQSFREQQEQRGVPRPHLRHQGALLPARFRRDQDLRQAARVE